MLILTLSGCKDDVKTNTQPVPKNENFTVKQLTCNLYANQQIRISIPDSLALRGSFSFTVSNPLRAGKIKFDTINGLRSAYFNFIPETDFIGQETLSYTICSPSRCDTSLLTINVKDINNCILTARQDTLTIKDTVEAYFNLALNDDTCSKANYKIITAPTYGTANLSSNGKLTYRITATSPNQQDRVEYELSAPRKQTVRSFATIKRIWSCLLIARPDAFPVILGSPRDMFVLENDAFCGRVAIVIDQQPNNGRVTVQTNSLGRQFVRYTPNINAAAVPDGFYYHLEINGLSSNSVRVNIAHYSRCNSQLPPSGQIGTYFLNQNSADSISLETINKIFDPNSRICEFSKVELVSVSPTSNQHRIRISKSGKLHYTPQPGGPRQVLLNYKVTDTLSNNSSQRSLNLILSPAACDSVYSLRDTTFNDSLRPGQPMIFDLEEFVKYEHLPCKPLIPNSQGPLQVQWIGALSQFLSPFNNNNPSRTQIKFQRAQGNTRPINTIINYAIPVFALNPGPGGQPRKVGELVGRVRVIIN